MGMDEKLVKIAHAFMSGRIAARIAYYPSLVYGYLSQSPERRWFDKVDDHILLGAVPFRWMADELVQKYQVKSVLTMNEEYETRWIGMTSQDWAQLGVCHLWIPVRDYDNSISVDKIQQGVDFIHHSVQQRKVVYVHCKAGRGRSVVVVLSYLVKEKGLSPDDAVNFIKCVRPQILLSPKQLKSLHEFAYQLNADI